MKFKSALALTVLAGGVENVRNSGLSTSITTTKSVPNGNAITVYDNGVFPGDHPLWGNQGNPGPIPAAETWYYTITFTNNSGNNGKMTANFKVQVRGDQVPVP
ncbi:hypothetical protein [Neobacillus sp. 114]|uniref:hypothetical protein n=1 Tax=Neobacillus sp. 114 TaxID=3048535 RepID=UPI001C244AA1|nr:hypothetical protein [Neobacillus sp. 114]MBU8914882.1 hypothetical protein [Bacillus sp. FJAT-29953]